MTRTNTLLTGSNLASLVTQVNAFLASRLTAKIEQCSYEIVDDDSTGGQSYQAVIQVEDTGVALAAPFVLQAFSGKNSIDSMALLTAYITANPTVFVSQPLYRPIIPGRRRTRYNPILSITCTDQANGQTNWAVYGGTGAGGPPSGAATGDLSGTYPGPSVFVGQLTVSPLAALTTLDTVAVVTYRAVEWAISAWKSATSAAHTSVITATSDGTTPVFTEDAVTIQPANGGTFDFTYSVAISGGNLLLQVTPLTTGWVFKLRRLTQIAP